MRKMLPRTRTSGKPRAAASDPRSAQAQRLLGRGGGVGAGSLLCACAVCWAGSSGGRALGRRRAVPGIAAGVALHPSLRHPVESPEIPAGCGEVTSPLTAVLAISKSLSQISLCIPSSYIQQSLGHLSQDVLKTYKK